MERYRTRRYERESTRDTEEERQRERGICILRERERNLV